MEIELDKTLHHNRGAKGTIRLNKKNGNFNVGDTLKFSILEKGNYNNVIFQKNFKVLEEKSSFCLNFTSEEMRIGEVISKEEEYWYELKLNDETPLIAFDREKAKKFILYPEAPNKEVNDNE